MHACACLHVCMQLPDDSFLSRQWLCMKPHDDFQLPTQALDGRVLSGKGMRRTSTLPGTAGRALPAGRGSPVSTPQLVRPHPCRHLLTAASAPLTHDACAARQRNALK